MFHGTASTNGPFVPATDVGQITDKGKQKKSEKTLSQCHSVLHKYSDTDMGPNLDLHGDMPTTTELQHV